MRKFSFFILILVLFPCANAADFYQGIRQMGMGGAAIAVVNDETSLLLNPIGLGRLREPYITLIDPEVTANMDSLTPLQNLSVVDAMDVEKLYEELGTMTDKRFFTRVQVFPSYANRDHGIGFLAKYDIAATRSSTASTMDLNYTSDWALVMGTNKSFWGGVLKIGGSVKFIDRVQYIGEVDAASGSMDLKDLASEGLGLGADAGLSLSSPTAWLPTISVMANNVGGTSFGLADGMRSYPNTVEPATIPMTLDVAVALFPIHNAKYGRSTFTIEMDDVLDKYDYYGSKQKLHAGVELNLVDQLFFRAGYNRGYVTGGFEWAWKHVQLQLAYYGEEIGTEEDPIKDERVAIKFAIRF